MVAALGDLSHFGKRFHRYLQGQVSGASLMVHSGKQVVQLCRGAVFGHVETDTFLLKCHA